jgi:hypothetical protein
MTIQELEDHLSACGLKLAYAHAYDGYRWLVSRTEDSLPVSKGSDPNETTMIAPHPGNTLSAVWCPDWPGSRRFSR